PFLQSGVLFDYHRRLGKPEPGLLVFKVSSSIMVPKLAPTFAKRRAQMDSEMARREFDAEFVAGIGQFITAYLLASCIASGVTEREPIAGFEYIAALDVSGGRSDRSALSIVHCERNEVIQDVLRVWDNKTSRQSVVAETVGHLQRFGLRRVFGDQFGAE